MSNRISQGSPFQPTTLKGPDAPAAPAVATRPPPQPKPAAPPPPPVDVFVTSVVRDFSRVLGQVGAAVSGAAASGNGGPRVRGDEEGKNADTTIENPGAAKTTAT